MDDSAKKYTSLQSLMLKAGRRTFFFDVRVSGDNKKHLKITESCFNGEGKARNYNSLLLFPDQLKSFQEKLSESINLIG